MSRSKDNEMEQIQQGLEAFLQQELEQMELEGKQAPQRKQAEPQLYTIDDDEEEPEETEELQRRLQQETGEIRTGEAGIRETRTREARKRERRDVVPEEEITRAGGTSSRQIIREDDYVEDWDAPRRKKPAPKKQTQPRDRYEEGKQASKKKNYQQRPYPSQDEEDEEELEIQRRKASKKRKKRRRRRHSGIRKFLITLLILIVLIAGGLYYLVGRVYSKMNYEEISSTTQEPLKEDGVINILLIGNDSRENGEDGRSDAMILVSISSKTNSIYMTSLLRDIYVDIPGHDGNRLNAAYSFGGAELLMETIEQNFDIPVNRYVLVNFEAFANLIDAVGGVDLELTTEELEYVNGYLVEYNMLTNRPQGTDNMDTSQAGMVHLNGPQALAYCRNRYIGTDFGRTERQRKVLNAAIKKMPTALATNGKELIGSLMPNLTTNLTQGECYQLGLMAGKVLTYDIVSDSIPQPGTYKDATIRGMAVLDVDFETNIAYLKEKIYGEGE